MNPQPEPNPNELPLPCDLCGSIAVRELYTVQDRLRNTELRFQIVECRGCGLWRTLPDMGEAELATYYPNDYWGGAQPSEKWIRSSQSEKTGFLLRCRLAGGSILDVGCGSGFFLRALDAAKWRRFGVEMSENAANAAKEALGVDHVFAGGLIQSPWPDAAFDVITFWSSLEHTNNPRENLQRAARMVKPGGTLIIQLPNARSYQARFFGGSWFSLDAPRHRYHFTKTLLERLLTETGFEAYRFTYFSKAHNSHALRHSLKQTLLTGASGPLSRALFYASLPFIGPFDRVMSALGRGATLTLAARREGPQL